ncbi:hypothetical protein [Pseudomonas sp. KU43P]|uniref:hypothetical protein n=1 Tax=Pseudomonas sp. KU43P TaxID=2487887 RepID=UPI002954B977|nr:hypothetical protein [Pseudomonas sp. KU43P]
MRHFMPIYANAYAYAASLKGAQVPVLRGFGAFSRYYSSTIGVCAERSDIQGLTAGDLVGDCETGNGTGFFNEMQKEPMGHERAARCVAFHAARLHYARYAKTQRSHRT